MRLRRGVATAALIAVVGGAAPARAQHHLDWRASLTLTGAYTQTISDAPFPTAQTFAGPLIAVTPSLVALLDTPRTENTLTYAFALNVPIPVQHTVEGVPVSYSNRLTYAGRYALNEITTATLGAGFALTPLNAFDASADPTAAPIQAVPSGAAYMLTATGTEGILRQLTERTSFAQAATFAYGDPIDPTSVRAKTYSAQNSFTITRSFSRDTLGGTLSNQANVVTAAQATAGSAITQVAPTFVNTLTANYTHAFTDALTTALTAGVSQTLSPGTAAFMQVQPTGTAALNYTFAMAAASLNYGHQAMPNLATGTIGFVDMVSLRFTVPISTTGVTTLGSAGYSRSQPLASAVSALNVANQLATTNVFLADVGVHYTPRQVETLTVGLRGQITRQFASGNVSDVNAALADDLTRYTLALSLTYSYPNAKAAQVRPSFTPLYSVQTPAPAEIVSTDRFFGDPISGPEPPEPAPKPVKSP